MTNGESKMGTVMRWCA